MVEFKILEEIRELADAKESKDNELVFKNIARINFDNNKIWDNGSCGTVKIELNEDGLVDVLVLNDDGFWSEHKVKYKSGVTTVQLGEIFYNGTYIININNSDIIN